MKSTGIVRKVDQLGRIVIPKELRRTLGILDKDALEIFMDEDQIILRKYTAHNTCTVTGEVSADNMRLMDGKIVLSEEGARQLLQELSELESN